MHSLPKKYLQKKLEKGWNFGKKKEVAAEFDIPIRLIAFETG